MKTIRKNYRINAPLKIVYNLLTNPEKIEEWSGAPAEMESRENGKFSLWDDSIKGINRRISRKKIIQDWKEKSWENYSKVTMNLKESGNHTDLELLHEQIPDNSITSIEKGWDEYYFGPLIELAENH